MGTSAPFGGGKNSNPLMPTWLDADENQSNSTTNSSSSEELSATESDVSVPAAVSSQSTIQVMSPILPVDNRFSAARRNFTSFVNSGGTDRIALGRALASYITKTAGGARQMAKRMKSERTASAKLGNILLQAGASSIRDVIRNLNLSNLVNQPVAKIYAALVDIICPAGGDLDNSIARDAYLEAIGEVVEMGLDDLEQPSVDTIAIIMECFISNAIRDRIMNAIATRIVTLPSNVRAVQNIEQQLIDFIRGAVSDAMTKMGRVFPVDQMSKTVDFLYERAFAVLEALAEQEAQQ